MLRASRSLPLFVKTVCLGKADVPSGARQPRSDHRPGSTEGLAQRRAVCRVGAEQVAAGSHGSCQNRPGGWGLAHGAGRLSAPRFLVLGSPVLQRVLPLRSSSPCVRVEGWRARPRLVGRRQSEVENVLHVRGGSLPNRSDEGGRSLHL